MTMWLVVILLVIVAVGALVWRSERRRKVAHPGSGFGSSGPPGGDSTPLSGG
jgi:hypothetical protein